MQIEKKKNLKNWYSRVVKIRNTSEAVLRPQYTPGHHTDSVPMGLGLFDSLGEYRGLSTASEVFLVLVFTAWPVQGQSAEIYTEG